MHFYGKLFFYMCVVSWKSYDVGRSREASPLTEEAAIGEVSRSVPDGKTKKI